MTTTARKYAHNHIAPGDYVQFRQEHYNLYTNLRMEHGFVMVVKEVDHYDDEAKVEFVTIYGDVSNAVVFMYTLEPANIQWPTAAVDAERRMERAEYRKAWKSLMRMYEVNKERVNYHELSTALFNVTIHRTAASDVAEWCGPTTSLFVYTYAQLPEDFRKDMFMRHMSDLRRIFTDS